MKSCLATVLTFGCFIVRHLREKKNHLSESYLQIVCTDSSSLFEKLLEKENSATFHHRNIINVAIQ